MNPGLRDIAAGLLFFLPALALNIGAARHRPPLPPVSEIREVRRSAAEDAAAVSLGARRLFADAWFIRLMQYYGTRESVHDERIREHHDHHHSDGSSCAHGPGWEKGDYPEFVPLSLHVIDLDPWFHSAVIYSAAYGFTLVSTLITKIALPTEVENSMNDINAAQRKRAAAQELAEADRIKRVTEATAEAEAMEKAGEGIANQRKAIALGIKDSLEIIQETGVGNDEANQLFMFTQWSEMMTEFARTGKTSTVVLPSDFSQSASMFEQMLTAGKVQNGSKE